ncbi:hypothetical protein AGMMS49965_25620 [Bacteroidia bacterium]|nr:hypothetical protein AGMMS49965_25620 [Bacteroidia bacterium]
MRKFNPLSPYKFGGKELDRTNGLNWYHQGFRPFGAIIPRTPTIDPLAEKYYSISPYAQYANNPVNYVDPIGMDIWEINQNGDIFNRIKDKTQDAFYMVAKDADGNYQRTFTTDAEGNKNYNSISFKYGTVESQRTTALNSTDTYDTYKVKGDNNGTQMFEFMAQNTTVEWSQVQTGIEGDKGLNFLTTSHDAATERGIKHLINGQLNSGYVIREFNHSHPTTPYPSGLGTTRKSDIGVVTTITEINKYWKYNVSPVFNIYHVPTKTYIPYSPNSQIKDFPK